MHCHCCNNKLLIGALQCAICQSWTNLDCANLALSDCLKGIHYVCSNCEKDDKAGERKRRVCSRIYPFIVIKCLRGEGPSSIIIFYSVPSAKKLEDDPTKLVDYDLESDSEPEVEIEVNHTIDPGNVFCLRWKGRAVMKAYFVSDSREEMVHTL